MVDMRYLKNFNQLNEEVLIEYDDRKLFINEIVSIFTNEVIDNFDSLEELDSSIDIDTLYSGIYYEYEDIYLALDLNEPFFSVNIYTQDTELFEQIIPFLCYFYEKINYLKFDVIISGKKIITKDEFFKKLWNRVNYMEDSWSTTPPFEIKILY